MILIFTSLFISDSLVNQVVFRLDYKTVLVIQFKDDVRKLWLCFSTSHLIGPADAFLGGFFAPYLALGRALSEVEAFINKLDEVREDTLRNEDRTEEGVHGSQCIVTVVFKERVELPFVGLVSKVGVPNIQLPICFAC